LGFDVLAVLCNCKTLNSESCLPLLRIVNKQELINYILNKKPETSLMTDF